MAIHLDWLHAFVRVAELSSFTQAAEQLGVPKARVSEKVRQLERELGSRLFARTTRAVTMTPDGEALLARAKRLVADAEELETMFSSRADLRGKVRIDLPVNIACDRVLPRVQELLREHPRLELLVSTTDRIVDVVREGFDAVVRVGALADSELTVVRLGELSMMNAASPEYLKRYGVPRTLEDLDAHSIVYYASKFGVDVPEFEFVVRRRTRAKRMNCLITVNSADAFRTACLAGLGIAQIPRLGATRLVRDGLLVEVLPRFTAPPLPVSLLHPHGRNVPRRVRVVTDWLVAILTPHLAA